MKRKVTIIPLLLLGLLIAGCQSNNTSSSSSSKPTSSSSTSTSTTKPSTSSSSSTAPTTPSSSSSHTICEDDNDGKVHIVILAGQSGARGKAVNTDLTDEQNVENFTPAAYYDKNEAKGEGGRRGQSVPAECLPVSRSKISDKARHPGRCKHRPLQVAFRFVLKIYVAPRGNTVI